jgi:hypothetical protein
MSKDDTSGEVVRNADFGIEHIPYTRDEIAGYIFAGMQQTKGAIEKWGGEELAMHTARGFADTLMFSGIRKKFTCPQCSRKWQPVNRE